MKITTKSRYAIRAIYALCRLGGDLRPVGMLKILECEDISKKYLEQIFTKLRGSNIITGARGVGGGYMLARPPETITLKEIIDLMDGPLAAAECVSGADCSNYSSCAVNWLWEGLKKCCDNYFEGITIADLIKRPAKI